jgi:glycosyltransferase involved in cell wall biosynthesis
MKVSIIIPSNLSPRRLAGKDSEKKLLRAVRSALDQDYDNLEVIVIADGCTVTMDLLRQEAKSHWIELIYMDKQPNWSGSVRNKGIETATGDMICYLDADDYLGSDHVTTLVKHFKGDWVWFNDMTIQGDAFRERTCVLKANKCGTSNIAHLRKLRSRWNEKNRYGFDDWGFIKNLLNESKNHFKIETPAYLVCHIPYGRGYDV